MTYSSRRPGGRRLATTLATALAALLALSACTTAQEAEQEEAPEDDTGCPVEVDESVSTTAQIAFQPIPNGDLIVRDEGWLEECMPNAEIDWSQFSSGAEVVQAFGSGTIDLGLLGSSPAVMVVSPPLDIDAQVVWIHNIIGEAESLVAHGDVSEITDLAGGTIAVPYGSTAHLSLLNALDDAGLVVGEDVDLINLQPDAMLGAWEREEIDAAWVWHPTLEVLLEDGTLIMSSEDTAEVGTATYDLAGATTEFIDANPEFMAIWTELQDLAVQQITEDPDRAAENIAAQLGISPDEAAVQMEGYVYLSAEEQAGDDYFAGGLGDDLTTTGDFLVDQNEIPEAASAEHYAEAIYRDAIESAAQ